MKVKANFEELKAIIVAAGKALKKGTFISAPAVKIEAKERKLIVSVSGTVDVTLSIPADVKESGTFVTGFSDINMLSVRKCGGDVNISSTDSGALLLKYKGSKANTILTQTNTPFNAMQPLEDNIQKVVLPLDSLKKMVRDTICFTESNTASDLHTVKLDISDDIEDGIMKIQMQTCDGKRFALRTVYAAKNGNYTGVVLLQPENLKTAMDIINDDEGDVTVILSGKKFFLQHEDTTICLPTLDKKYPDMSNLIASRAPSFTVKMDKAEFIEALNCVIYLQNENNLKNGTDESVIVQFLDNEIGISSEGVTSYNEKIEAETTGNLPGIMLFNTKLLKDAVSVYPNGILEIGGTHTKAPLWLCAGDHDEYIFCLLPRARA